MISPAISRPTKMSMATVEPIPSLATTALLPRPYGPPRLLFLIIPSASTTFGLHRVLEFVELLSRIRIPSFGLGRQRLQPRQVPAQLLP